MTAVTPGVRLGPASEVPVGEGRAYAVCGETIAVFRQDNGALRAMQGICPHAGGPLADGMLDDAVLVCPLHLNVWELATGCSKTGQPDLVTYGVEEVDGELVVHLPGGCGAD